MNSAIQAPTRAIKLDTSSPNFSKWVLAKRIPCSKEVKTGGQGPRRKDLDFYSMFSQSDDTAYDDAVSVYEMDNNNVTLDYLILSLKNDIRVYSFVLGGSCIRVLFKTTDDAISFYRQYFYIIPMAFVTEHWFGPEIHRCAGDRLHTDSISWGDAYSCPVPFQRAGGHEEAIERRENALAAVSVILEEIGQMQSKEQPHILHGESNTGRQRATFGSLISTCISSTEAADSPDAGRDVVLHVGEQRKEKGPNSPEAVSLRPEAEKLSKPAHHSNSAVEMSERESFERRVEYFNNLKSFFSKNDVKKMETLYAEGRTSFLYMNSKEISCGCYSNVIMQNAVKTISELELFEIINNLGVDIAPLSATKHGAYTIQTILLRVESAMAQELISANFSKYGMFLLDHAIGNYAIQKILRFNVRLVLDMCMRDIPGILSSQLSFKVFKRCLGFFKFKSDELTDEIVKATTVENADKCKIVLQLLNGN